MTKRRHRPATAALLLSLSLGCSASSDPGSSKSARSDSSPSPVKASDETYAPAFSLQGTENVIVPDGKSPHLACRDRSDVAKCLALTIAGRRPKYLLKIYLVAGEGAAAVFPVRDNITLYGVSDLEIVGIPTLFGTKPVLKHQMPENRNLLQYWLVHLVDVRNVKLRNLILDGADKAAGRGIGVCGLNGSVQQLSLEQLQLRNFIYFNVLVGNAFSGDQLTKIAGYPAGTQTPPTPQQRLIVSLRDNPNRPAGCGGDIHGLAFSNNTVYMKSVGFYLVPHSALTSSTIPVQTPIPSGNTAVPTWYGEERTHAKRVSEISITDNKFINALPDPTREVVDANGYHSAIKLHHATGTIVRGNTIEATNAPLLFASGAAINLAAGMFDTKVERNRIFFPASRTQYPHGIGVDSTYISHSYYGFGDKLIFGPGTGLDVRDNALQGAKVRFMDCCVQESATAPNFRPYCAQRDDLVSRGLLDEGINLKGNTENGVSGRDAALIWRSSVNERAWVNGQYATQCREQLRVTFK